MNTFQRLVWAIAAIGMLSPAVLAQEEQPPKDREHEERTSIADERFARMKEEVAELRRAGKHEEAEKLAKRIEAAWQKHQEAEGRRPKEPVENRLDHIRQAIRHLSAAGMPEHARRLEAEARELQQAETKKDRGERVRDRERGDDAQAERVRREVGELREHVQRLAKEVQQLREQAQHR